MDIEELTGIMSPENTVLLLGAGAAVSSGAPTGAALAKFLAERMSPPPQGSDLSEIAGIYENRLGRRALAEAIKGRLENLRPTGGLLALPQFNWRAIYSTNFDTLVEQAYRAAGRDLDVYRSNFDFSRVTHTERANLYKIHGDISQDIAFGHHARMVLTEADYDEVQNYRQALFNGMQQHMYTADTVIVGQSLQDAHLRQLAKDVGALRVQGIQGRVFLLAFEYDADRAQLYARINIQVVAGTLENYLHSYTEKQKAISVAVKPVHTSESSALPVALLNTTRDVAHAANLNPDATRVFHGEPASYADLKAGLVITRAVEHRLRQTQEGARGYFVVLSGAAGVGKTTLARSILFARSRDGFACFEHLNSFPLDVQSWIEMEAKLRKSNRQGVLLIDDCASHLPAVNRLVDSLGALDRPFLRVIVTINAAQWRTRTKSRFFFSRGSFERLSTLTDSDISELINLVDRQPTIKQLVESDFLQLSRRDRVRRLRDRCSADMFVCLKNIFRTETLDNILLQEFADLDPSAREVYRYVAAVQAMGGKVHRQLIVRLLGIEPNALSALLGHMDGVVSEYDISYREGLFGWSTRHDVIAKTISTYKFADQSELYELLNRLVDGLNPTFYIEMETARAIASDEMGINRLQVREQQIELLHKLIDTVPAERTPRRRLVRLFLQDGNLVEADRAIGNFRRDVGEDNIINRYRSILSMRRADVLEGILEEDRVALLRDAERIARQCIDYHPYDRFNYRTLGDVAVAFGRRTGNISVLQETIEMMKAVEGDIQDPDVARDRRSFEAELRTLIARSASEIGVDGEAEVSPVALSDETLLADADS